MPRSHSRWFLLALALLIIAPGAILADSLAAGHASNAAASHAAALQATSPGVEAVVGTRIEHSTDPGRHSGSANRLPLGVLVFASGVAAAALTIRVSSSSILLVLTRLSFTTPSRGPPALPLVAT